MQPKSHGVVVISHNGTKSATPTGGAAISASSASTVCIKDCAIVFSLHNSIRVLFPSMAIVKASQKTNKGCPQWLNCVNKAKSSCCGLTSSQYQQNGSIQERVGSKGGILIACMYI